jgi:hypothetical protein
MATLQQEPRVNRDPATRNEVRSEIHYETWVHWPVNWTAIWVGALASLCALLIFGLAGIAVGAHLLGPEHRVVNLKSVELRTLIFSVCGTFFAFVIGGWIAGKIAGILHSEPGMLHGAIVWAVATPLLAIMVTLGLGSVLGGWYGGLSGSPSWAAPAAAPFERPVALDPGATSAERQQYRDALASYQEKVRVWNEETPKATRNAALGAITALLLGLIGSVIGGWMASGEPMNFTHYQTRTRPAIR